MKSRPSLPSTSSLLILFITFLCLFPSVLSEDLTPLTMSSIIKKLKEAGKDNTQVYQIGNYTCTNLLSHNGVMAIVAKCHHTSTGIPVIIKRNINSTLEVMANEIKAMGLTNNAPNVTPLLDVIIEEEENAKEKIPYLVIERFNGVNAGKLNLSLSDLKKVFYEVFQTVAHANEKRVYHNDLHPDNWMINLTTMEVRVIDWGIANIYNESVKVPSHKIVRDVNKLARALLLQTLMAMGVNERNLVEIAQEYRDRVYWANPLKTKGFARGLAREKIHHKPNRRSRKDRDEKVVDEIIATPLSNEEQLAAWIKKYKLEAVDPKVWDFIDKTISNNTNVCLSGRKALEHPYFDEVRTIKKNIEEKPVNVLLNQFNVTKVLEQIPIDPEKTEVALQRQRILMKQRKIEDANKEQFSRPRTSEVGTWDLIWKASILQAFALGCFAFILICKFTRRAHDETDIDIDNEKIFV